MSESESPFGSSPIETPDIHDVSVEVNGKVIDMRFCFYANGSIVAHIVDVDGVLSTPNEPQELPSEADESDGEQDDQEQSG